MFEGEGFVRNSPPVVAEGEPVVAEGEDSAVPNGRIEGLELKGSLFEKKAFVPMTPLADGGLELLLLGLPSVVPTRPFADGASDVVLLEEPKPENPVMMGNVTLGASAASNKRPVESAFEV